MTVESHFVFVLPLEKNTQVFHFNLLSHLDAIRTTCINANDPFPTDATHLFQYDLESISIPDGMRVPRIRILIESSLHLTSGMIRATDLFLILNPLVRDWIHRMNPTVPIVDIDYIFHRDCQTQPSFRYTPTPLNKFETAIGLNYLARGMPVEFPYVHSPNGRPIYEIFHRIYGKVSIQNFFSLCSGGVDPFELKLCWRKAIKIRELLVRRNYFEASRNRFLAGIAQVAPIVYRTVSTNVCLVCMDLPYNIVFLPCRHMACCSTCAIGIQICPICRVKIEQSIRVYPA